MVEIERGPSLLEIALLAILREVEGKRPYSADSYLPDHLVQLAKAALILVKEERK